jgi:hypothetical protein
MVLIGLSECLRSSSGAEKALRDILIVFFAALGIPREVHRKINPAKLDLRRQLKMLSLWTQNRQNAPMMPVLNFAAALLSQADRQLHQTGPHTIARMARTLFPDAWAIYAKTVSFFGYTVDAPRITPVLDWLRRSPGQVAREDESVGERLLSA